jgi:hypothetical protein
MGGTGLIAGIQLRSVFMWCCKLDIGAHHACGLLLQAVFIIASVAAAGMDTRAPKANVWIEKRALEIGLESGQFVSASHMREMRAVG